MPLIQRARRRAGSRWTALVAGALLGVIGNPVQALECSGSLTQAEITEGLAAEGPNYFFNIPASLRFGGDDVATTETLCDLYRAADGMEGALCIRFSSSDEVPDEETLANVQQPLGTYGDNAVDRLVRVPIDPASGTISCELANTLLLEATNPLYVPAEIDSRAGQVCVRDVMRAPGVPTVLNAVIRDSAGTEFSTGPLINDGAGRFSLDDTYAAGSFQVLSFEVDTFGAGIVDLGRVADLVQPELMDTRLSGVWFLEVDGIGADVGSLDAPFNSIASFNAAQGTTNGPQPGDFIYLIRGDSDELADQLVMLDDQWLVDRSEGLLEALAAYGVMPTAGSPLLDSEFVEPGFHTSLRGFERSPIVLARDNTLRGLALDTAFAVGLNGDNLGSLTVRDTNISVSNGGVIAFSNMEIDIELFNVFGGGGVTFNGVDLENTPGRLSIDGGLIIAVAGETETELGRAVSLVNASNVSLTNLELESTRNSVYGRGVENFSLATSSLTSVGSDPSSTGIDFEQLTGEVLIDSVEISAGAWANIIIRNSEGELNATLEELDLGVDEGGTLTSVVLEAQDTAAMSVTLTDSLLRGARNRALECLVGGSANMECHLLDNQVFQARDDGLDNRYREHPLLFRSLSSDGLEPGEFVLNYSVAGTAGGGHTIDHSFRGAIAGEFEQGSGTVTGVISNLTFGEEGNPLSGALFGNAIEINTSGTIGHNLMLSDTKMFGAFNDGALRILGAGTTATTIRNLQFFGDDADLLIQVSDTASEPAEDSAGHCIDIADSMLVSWDSPRFFGLSQRSGAGGRLHLPGYAGSPNGEALPGGLAGADVTAYLADRNVNLVSFNPEVEPVAYAPNVVGLMGGVENCADSLELTQ